MAGRGGYNTKTRQLILDYLINNRQHAVSASNILEHLEAEGASPNPTTVYRYLDKLAGEQRIMKYVADKGEKAVFQYVAEGRHCRDNERLPSAPTNCPKQVQGEAHGGSFGARSLCGFHRPALAAKEP